MTEELQEQVLRLRIGSPTKWMKDFDVNDYLDNPQMIEKLYEEKQSEICNAVALENENKDLRSRLEQLGTETHGLRSDLRNKKRDSWLAFGSQFVAAVFLGIGVNYLTASTPDASGWVFVGAAAIFEAYALLLTSWRGSKK